MTTFEKKCAEIKSKSEAKLLELRRRKTVAGDDILDKIYRIGLLIAEFFLKEGKPTRPRWWWALRKVPALLADIIKIILE